MERDLPAYLRNMPKSPSDTPVNKKTVALWIWILFSVAYVLFDLWNGFKVGIMDRSYQAGAGDTVRQLIERAEKSGCEPFSAYVGNQSVELVKSECLKKTGESGGAEWVPNLPASNVPATSEPVPGSQP